jgi:heptosyltransferase-3
MRRILVLRGGALGDFIVTLPALLSLRRQWPTAEIVLVGNATVAEIAVRRGTVDQVLTQHGAQWRALFESTRLPPNLATWLAAFDLVVNFWPDPDGTLTRHFPLGPQQQFLSASAMPTCAPAAAHYSAALEPLGIRCAAQLCRIQPNEIDFFPTQATAVEEPNRPANGPVAIHPGSGSVKKNWPIDRWLEVIARIGRPVQLILGEVEYERWMPLVSRGFASSVEVLARPNLEELIEAFTACPLFLGHDSGVSHLAAACGAPSVLLFGPTDPAMWAPPAPHIQVLRHGDALEAIAVDDVLAVCESTRSDRKPSLPAQSEQIR